jgi:hypothetical protein
LRDPFGAGTFSAIRPDAKLSDSTHNEIQVSGKHPVMAKPHRGLKKANHGKRPANSKARRSKRKDIRT